MGQRERNLPDSRGRSRPHAVSETVRRRARIAGVTIACLTSAGCASAPHRESPWPWTVATRIADTISSEAIAPGVRLHHLVRVATPLRAHVLDIDLAACVSLRAVKGAETAVGSTTTSALLRAMPRSDAPIAAVNADFFTFTPPGVPTNALIQDGRLLAGPINRPVLAFDAEGRPSIGVLNVIGTIDTPHGRVPIRTWNRPSPNAVGIVDAAWGQALDTLTRPDALYMVPVGDGRYRVAAMPASHTGRARGDTLVLVGRARAALVGDTVRVAVSVAPAMPREAVGGYPLLVRDSVIVPSVDSSGAVSFRGVNPRTAAGIAANGRRLLLVVIDGRQAGYSGGTTTRETAALLLALGAREAVNLDGGGSTAMVARDATTGAVRVINKPSDAAGERPVGDALAVIGRCGRR